ncbi:MAG TPA: MBOAT family O-acyltransferase [Verrucomicrobiota bacterium]|nr:membrane-bound O-acyltransferase family protein [Verrucomicrobiales bacterium]HRI15239.1 MBOAT family O-acyltransferase [Verrucomicrobiota bacterium]
MNFSESRFWIVLLSGLALGLGLRLLLRPWLANRLSTFDRLLLTGLGLYLLLSVSALTFVIFMTVAVVSYVGLWLILRIDLGHQKGLLFILIPLQLLPLFYYKYSNFLLNQVLSLNFSTLRDLGIPVGISFYTFQKVAFVVDTLAFRKPLPRFLDYMCFAGFFPQVVAGPIERREGLLPQMEQFRFRWDPVAINEGAAWIVLGLFFKCCLGDNIAAYFIGVSTTNPFSIWLDNLTFGFRLYYDFAGYSLVALGLARCLGITLTLNFLSPYCATSMVEFWRRWHVSLSQWFRDYLYIPMGGGRSRFWMFNLAVVFVVSGIWHGAGWGFVIWGALHAVALIGNRLLSPRLKVPRTGAWLLTMTIAFGAWLAFYETNPGILWAKARTMLTPAAYSMAALQETLHHWPGGDRFVLACFLGMAAVILLVEWRSVAGRDHPYFYLRRPWVSGLLIVLTVLLAATKNNAFIYFAF